jgi:hypothetical protein
MDPAKQMRLSEYLLATTQGGATPTVLNFDTEGMVIPMTDSWPRFFILVSKPPANGLSERMYVIAQTDPKSQYRLWGWVRLYAGVTLPPTAPVDTGAPLVTPDDAKTRMSPEEAVAHYGDVLNAGESSQYFAEFSQPDLLRDELVQRMNKYQTSLSVLRGNVSLSSSVGEQGMYAIQTADGGAIVIAGYRTELTATFSGGTIRFPTLAPFAGRDNFTSNIHEYHDSVVALWIPPSGSEQTIQLLGAEHVLTGAIGE